RKTLAGIRQSHRNGVYSSFALIRFDQGDQFAKDLADVSPVDLVDHHCEFLIRCRSCLPAQILEDTCTDFVLDFTGLCIAVENRSESLHELLVTVGLVEGDEAVAFDMFARRWASSVLAHKLVFPRLLGNRGHGLLVLSLNQLRQLVSLPSAGRA